jgi:hypothetical protein
MPRSARTRALSDLIGELSTRSQTFRTWRAAHNVLFHRTGLKRFRHPVVGGLTLAFAAMGLAADTGLKISAYTAEPGSASEDALNLLASWAATLDQAEAAHATDGPRPAVAEPARRSPLRHRDHRSRHYGHAAPLGSPGPGTLRFEREVVLEPVTN